MEKSLQDENASKFAPVAFAIMGEVFGKLALSSLRVPSSVSIKTEDEGITFKTAEDAFLKALELRAAQGRQDGYERFYYASFLERYYYPKRARGSQKSSLKLFDSRVPKCTDHEIFCDTTGREYMDEREFNKDGGYRPRVSKNFL